MNKKIFFNCLFLNILKTSIFKINNEETETLISEKVRTGKFRDLNLRSPEFFGCSISLKLVSLFII